MIQNDKVYLAWVDKKTGEIIPVDRQFEKVIQCRNGTLRIVFQEGHELGLKREVEE